MKTAEEILYSCDSVRGRGYRKEDILEAMGEYGKEMYNQAIEDAAENAETYEYPYLDACGECGHTATYVDKDSILRLKKK